MTFRIGADIGGTFTDVVLVGDDGETFAVGKVLTTPDEPDEAVVRGVREILATHKVDPGTISHVVHGTTLFTNAIIERKGAKTALVTTAGFRDAVEIAREHRFDMYDLYMQRPAPLAPRHLRFEVRERVYVDGTVMTPLDPSDVQTLLSCLKEAEIEAVAVSLIHSYANPAHEQQIGRILSEGLPDVAITLSSDLVPEIREYERTSTTLVNVYVQQIARSYLERLRNRLRAEAGVKGDLYIMQSNGGVCEVDVAARFPVRLVESGPAAGALATSYYGRRLGHDDLLSFDMGGTTAKACVIADGSPLIASEFEVDRQYQFKKGSGLPVKVPVIEMIEIGTGGGSIARVDDMKRLQVGPDSAGSNPGPASYGLGGDLPTVTDADLVLGYLDPGYFLGGQMTLDVSAAQDAILRNVAEPLGIDLVQAAWGVHQLANESMASASRLHSIERGKDIEKFPIFAFGGAGPVHAFGVARILRSPQVIYPLGAGVMSAVGFLTAPLSLDFVRSLPGLVEALDWDRVMAAISDMEAEGRSILTQTLPEDALRFQRFADMRYQKQGYEIRVPVPDGELSEQSIAALRASFESVYRGLYGHVVPDTPVEAVSWRVVASSEKPELDLGAAKTSLRKSEALKGEREVYLPGEDALAPVPIYARYALTAGTRLDGPAVIEERESTVVIQGDARIEVDEIGALVVDLR